MNPIIKNLFLIIGSLLFSEACYSGTIDPNTPDQKYVEYGEKFEYVHGLCGTYKDNSLFCASAVAIAPNWILTAAHVVENYRTCLVKREDVAYLISDVFVHPDFVSDKFGHGDIALCHVSQDLGLKFYPELYEDNDECGKLCSISGWGLTGNFHTGVKVYDGKRRAGSNYIDKIDRDLLICTPSVKHQKTSLEFLICSGDSGGGLFIGNKLAGINSCVLSGNDRKPNSNYGDEAGHTRISLYVNWIKDTIKKKQAKEK
jgi:hypothetical protein